MLVQLGSLLLNRQMADIYLDKLFQEVNLGVHNDSETKILRLARDLEVLLNVMDDLDELSRLILKEHAEDVIRQMNEKSTHINEVVRVTGQVLRAYYSELDEKYMTETVDWQNKSVRSIGFSVEPIPSEDGQSIRMTVGHVFLVGQLDEEFGRDAQLVGTIPRLYAFARVGEVDIFHSGQSDDRRNDLDRTIPEVMASVDAAMSTEGTECDKLLATRSLAIEPEDDIPEATIEKLGHHIYNALGFDVRVPYVLSVRGIIYQSNSTNAPLAYRDAGEIPQPRVVFPIGIKLLPYPKVLDGVVTCSQELRTALQVIVISKDKTVINEEFMIPIQNISEFRSLWPEAFTGADATSK